MLLLQLFMFILPGIIGDLEVNRAPIDDIEFLIENEHYRQISVMKFV